MKYNHTCIFALLLLLTACTEQYFDESLSVSKQGTDIIIHIDEPLEVITRNATPNENSIDDLYVLIFDNSDNFIAGEKVNVSTQIIDTDLPAKKIIKSQLPIAFGNKIMILINTGVSELPTGLTYNNINDKFPSTNWNLNQADVASGRGLPMSSHSTWDNSPRYEVLLSRAIAKVQLSIDPSTSYAPGVVPFDANTTTWTMALYPDKGSIFKYDFFTFPEMSTLTFKTPEAADFTKYAIQSNYKNEKLAFYSPEYRSSVYAKTTEVYNYRFHKDRMCMLIKNNGKFYRLDFFESGKWIDVIRNYNYKFVINKVLSNGYPTIEDALINPPSNVLYSIVSDDSDTQNSCIISNGQYALTYEFDQLEAYSSRSTEFSLTAKILLPPTNIEVPRNNSITGNGITITNGVKAVDTKNTTIKFKLNENNTGLSGSINITVGNISKTIPIKVIENFLDAHVQEKKYIGDYSSVTWTNINNMRIHSITPTELTIRCKDNVTPVKWIIPATGATSNKSVPEAEPVFEAKTTEGYKWSNTGSNVYTKVIITQVPPDYAGWAGGEPNQTGATYYSKRLVVEAIEESATYLPWAAVDYVTGIQDLERGKANTLQQYNKGDSYKAAVECWKKNDKNFDNYIDATEIGDNPWYVPAFYQMQEIWLSYPNFNNKFRNGYYYWTSTEYKTHNEYAFVCRFEEGYMHYGYKTTQYLVRCVKDLPN